MPCSLALGVPVIGTQVDGLADVLAQQRGVLVPPEDPAALSTRNHGLTQAREPLRYARVPTATGCPV